MIDDPDDEVTDFEMLARALRRRFAREQTWSSRGYRAFRVAGAALVATLITGGL